MPDKDGKIYIAHSEFLALKSGEYTFYVDPSNANVANRSGSELCVVGLTVTDKHGVKTHIIDGDKVNAYYTAGPTPISMPAIGAVNLASGAYRMALRTACGTSAEADITADPWAATRFTIYTMSPGETSVRPINPGEFVYRLAR
jgi:inosine-uridine nucleoside N-ribohydrolase